MHWRRNLQPELAGTETLRLPGIAFIQREHRYSTCRPTHSHPPCHRGDLHAPHAGWIRIGVSGIAPLYVPNAARDTLSANAQVTSPSCGASFAHASATCSGFVHADTRVCRPIGSDAAGQIPRTIRRHDEIPGAREEAKMVYVGTGETQVPVLGAPDAVSRTTALVQSGPGRVRAGGTPAGASPC